MYGSEQDSDNNDNLESDEFFSRSGGAEDSDGGQKKPKVIMYAKKTKFAAVKEAGKTFMEWHLTRKNRENEWDVGWYDVPPKENDLMNLIKSMHFHQRINHYPGIYNITKKNALGNNLNKLAKLIPQEFDFFPETYMMPHDYKEFSKYIENQKNPRTFICKPADGSQGKGIFLTRDTTKILPTDHMVVQKYLHKPHLIDDLKYDLRVYAVVYGMNPIRVYIYKDGLARFATEKY